MFLKLALFSIFFLTMIFPNTYFSQTPPIEPGVSQTLAKWRSANYSDIRYKLNITLEKGAPLMKGDIEIRVNLTETGAKNDLILDWRTTQFANDKDKPFANVVAVNETTGAQASRLHRRESGTLALQSDEHLIISKSLLKTGENVIKIEFASPIKTSGAAITRYVDKEDGAEYIYSLFVPSDASTAFPVFDQPDLKARFQLNVTAPNNWQTISNTNQESYEALPSFKDALEKYKIEKQKWLEELEKRGLKDISFAITKPISTYVFAFAAGEFKSFTEKTKDEVLNEIAKEQNATKVGDTIKVIDGEIKKRISHIYVRKSQAEKFKQHAAEVFRLNREGVKFLESWFDYKFPFPKYDLVLIPEFPFGGMEHAGATFLREDRVIFPTEPTKNDFITRANLIFHEAAHQWFGDTVTMKWFDDLWLKEGFAEFMAYKTLEKVLPEYNAWKIFYERNKQAAYLTDVTRGTTPIYQEIPNLSSAKSAYGNIVYRKAPSFLKQAEFYLGEDKFQTAVRAFLKKHEFANAEWTDLVKEFEIAGKEDLKYWGENWVKERGLSVIPTVRINGKISTAAFSQKNIFSEDAFWLQKIKILMINQNNQKEIKETYLGAKELPIIIISKNNKAVLPNYQDYGYGIFLLDEKSRAYVLENIQTEKDDFLRSMMWGSLWDSVRFYELAPEDYVKLVIKNINVEQDESTIQSLLGRVSTAMNYYIENGGTKSVPPASAGGSTRQIKASKKNQTTANAKLEPSANADGTDLSAKNGNEKAALAAALEKLLINKIETAPTIGQKITYFRALQSIGSSEQTKQIFKDLLNGKSKLKNVELKTKDKFDLVTRLIVLGDKDALDILANLEKTEIGDAAKRYAYAAKAGIPTAENKAKYWRDFTENKEIAENWIESAFNVWNTPRHADLTLPYLQKALAELPSLKRSRKIFFVNGWLSSFIGGQKSKEALEIVNNFLEKNSSLDKDLRLKILENSDNLERAVKIREKYSK